VISIGTLPLQLGKIAGRMDNPLPFQSIRRTCPKQGLKSNCNLPLDDVLRSLHNLASLLLNKTLQQTSGLFKNIQSISVGV
jgi:hypothetical protein